MDNLKFVIENWEFIFSLLGIGFSAGGFVVWCKMSISSMKDQISSLKKELEEKNPIVLHSLIIIKMNTTA